MEAAARGRMFGGAALAITVLCTIVPLFLVRGLSTAPADAATVGGVGAATAALGALFRSGTRQLLRSTLVMAVRATTRTASRRALRSMLPMILRLLLPATRTEEQRRRSAILEHDAFELTVAFVGLAGSFAVVAALQAPDTRAALLGGIPLWEASCLAAAPAVLRYLVLWAATSALGVRMQLHVAVDGLLIQAYFTGAASFLPMLTDTALEGSARGKALCALAVLLSFVGGAGACFAVAGATGSHLATFVATIFVLYAFVCSFPFNPLDGRDLWDWSRSLWFLLWGGCMLLFMRLPEVMYGIL